MSANAVTIGGSHFGNLRSKSVRASVTISFQYHNGALSSGERLLIRESKTLIAFVQES